MSTEHEREHAVSCPKRRWVLEQLSDEDCRDERGDLPPGLRAHLAHCEDCRSVAAELADTSHKLSLLACGGPCEELAAQARARVRQSLLQGGRSSGRIELDQALEEEFEESEVHSIGLLSQGKYAMAAIIALAVVCGLWAGYTRFWPSSPIVEPANLVKRSSVRIAPPSEVEPLLDPSELVQVDGALAGQQYSDGVDDVLRGHEGTAQPAFARPDPQERKLLLFGDRKNTFNIFNIDTEPSVHSTTPKPTADCP